VVGSLLRWTYQLIRSALHQQVNRNILPPPLNLLQFLPIPGYQRHVCWALWALFGPLLCGTALCALIVPASVCIALQAGSLPMVKRGKRYRVPLLNRLSRQKCGCLYKFVPRLAPLSVVILIPIILMISIGQSCFTFLYALFDMRCGTTANPNDQHQAQSVSLRSALKTMFPLKDPESLFVSLAQSLSILPWIWLPRLTSHTVTLYLRLHVTAFKATSKAVIRLIGCSTKSTHRLRTICLRAQRKLQREQGRDEGDDQIGIDALVSLIRQMGATNQLP